MKQTRLSFLVAAIALGATSAAMANPFIAPPEPTKELKADSPYVFQLGTTNYRETYVERVDGEKLMQEEASMFGVQGSVTRAFRNGGQAKLSGSFATGDADYTGSYQGGNYGDVRIGNLDRYAATAELEYKYGSRDWNDIVFGTGVGFRRLVDRLDQAGPGGYKRENDRVYLSVSVERQFAAGEWLFTPQFKYKHLVWGVQRSDIEGGLKMKQDKGYGTELALAISHKNAWHGLTVTPYLRTWDIKDSETVRLSATTGVYEPRNKTKEIGVTLSLAF